MALTRTSRWAAALVAAVAMIVVGLVGAPEAAAAPASLPVAADSAPAVAKIAASENLLVVRTKDNRIFFRYWKDLGFFAGEDTLGWQEVPGGGRTPFAPAAVRSDNDKIYVAVVGLGGGGMWLQTFDRITRTWSGSWTNYGGSFSAGPELAPDGGAANLTMLAPGLDGQVYYKLWRPNATGDGWRHLPGMVTSREVAARWVNLSDNGWLPYQLVVAARGNDARIYTATGLGTLGGSFTWSGWSQLPGGGLTDHAPAMEELDTGQVHDVVTVMIRGLDSAIYYQTMLFNVWNAVWRRLDHPGSTPFSPAIFINGTPTVYVVGPDRAIYQQKLQTSYTPPGAQPDWRVWFPWELQPGWITVKGSLVKPPTTPPSPPPPPPPGTSTHQYFLYCVSHFTGSGTSGTHYFNNVYAWATTVNEGWGKAANWGSTHQPGGTTFLSVVGGSCSANYGFNGPTWFTGGGPNG